MKRRVDGLPEQMLVIHLHLRAARIEHAFGGALALPRGIVASASDRDALASDGQARLWWETTPVDLFLSITTFHQEVATRVRWEPFAGAELPFLACEDLAVFEACFNRTKDWADLEAMRDAGTLDVDATASVLVRYLGADDERIARLRALVP